MKDMFVSLILFCATIGSTPALAAIQGGSDDALFKAIEQRSNEFAKVVSSGDAVAAAQFYTEDGVFIAPGGVPQKGRVAISSDMARGFKNGPPKFELTTKTVEQTGDQVVETGTWKQTIRGPQGQRASITGQYLVVWQKGPGGDWLMDYDFINLDPPEVPNR